MEGVHGRSARGEPTWEVKKRVTNIPATHAQEYLACGQHVTCATVYASATSPRVSGQASPIVRVNLEAELANIQRPIASAFVPAGYSGPVIVVTGLAAASFHVTCQSDDPRAELALALTTRDCCAAFSVFVPPELLPPNGDPDPPCPWAGLVGQYWHYSSSAANQAVPLVLTPSLGLGLRVVHMSCTGQGNNAVLNLHTPSAAVLTYHVPNTPARLESQLGGNLEIVALSWANMRTLLVEGVR